mmetsp:Transcript_75080/g.213548  ORF Transcript_75080/g.213548 Transcript_75080/m.213548 type:complete len:170 (-) Transcript_75080:1-510(-)
MLSAMRPRPRRTFSVLLLSLFAVLVAILLVARSYSSPRGAKGLSLTNGEYAMPASFKISPNSGGFGNRAGLCLTAAALGRAYNVSVFTVDLSKMHEDGQSHVPNGYSSSLTRMVEWPTNIIFLPSVADMQKVKTCEISGLHKKNFDLYPGTYVSSSNPGKCQCRAKPRS